LNKEPEETLYLGESHRKADFKQISQKFGVASYSRRENWITMW